MDAIPGYTRVLRAVSEIEYEQILATSTFEIVKGGSEGKHFADTVEGARRFGEALMGIGQFRLIEADVPDDAESVSVGQSGRPWTGSIPAHQRSAGRSSAAIRRR
jgi:hypothetical protein